MDSSGFCFGGLLKISGSKERYLEARIRGDDFRVNKDVLDGFVFLLEGNRLKAKKCNKKTYKLLGRGSPRYDKIGALCDYIFEYEGNLRFKYEQMNKIN